MALPELEENHILDTAADIIAPLMQVLSLYQIPEKERMHYQRILRSIMHGFSSLESAGFFTHFPIDNDESYLLAINNIINNLETLETQTAKHSQI